MTAAKPKFPKLNDERRKELKSFLTRFKLELSDLKLLDLALTHRSYGNEFRTSDNERLEYLGDSVLGLIINEFLYRRLPSFEEGKLSNRKSSLVSGANLAHIAAKMDLGSYLRLGKGEAKGGGAKNASNLENAYEAVVGAIYLEAGLEAARSFVESSMDEILEELTSGDYVDHKTKLQILCQKRHKMVPVYKVLDRQGPDHEITFTVEVSLDGKPLATAKGSSKRIAEQQAAGKVLKNNLLD